MNQLPPELYRIVFRYVYDSVLFQLKEWYGTKWLKQVPYIDCCDRINNDIVRYGFVEDNCETYFKFMYSYSKAPSNAVPDHWLNRLRRLTIHKHMHNNDIILWNAS